MAKQSNRPGATRQIYQFYMTTEQRKAVGTVLGRLSFSAYVASAVLKEAQRDGAAFYGDVRDGACARAAPERGASRCTSGQAASWWNRLTRAFYCATCAVGINAFEPGACLSPEALRAGAPPPIPGSE